MRKFLPIVLRLCVIPASCFLASAFQTAEQRADQLPSDLAADGTNCTADERFHRCLPAAGSSSGLRFLLIFSVLRAQLGLTLGFFCTLLEHLERRVTIHRCVETSPVA